MACKKVKIRVVMYGRVYPGIVYTGTGITEEAAKDETLEAIEQAEDYS